MIKVITGAVLTVVLAGNVYGFGFNIPSGLQDAVKQINPQPSNNDDNPKESAGSPFGGLMNGMGGLGGAPKMGGQPGGMAGMPMGGNIAELDKETRRGPVGRLNLGFNQIGTVYGGYPNRYAHDDEVVEYVSKIIRVLAGSSRLPYPYQGWLPLVVEGSGDASAAAGGLVLIQTGLFGLVETEDELAGVLAHEMSHVEIDHSGYDYKSQQSAKAFDEMGGGSGVAKAEVMHSVQTMTGFSVQAEAEADARAIEIMKSAGYNPYALLRVIERLNGEKAQSLKGKNRFQYINNLKYKGASGGGGGNKYPEGRATLLLDALENISAKDIGDHPARTARFNRILKKS